MKRKNRGILLIVTGLLLSFSAAAMFGAYEYQAEIAGDNAELLLTNLRVELQRDAVEQHIETIREEVVGEMPKATLNGYALIGELDIPTIGLELPVLDNWSYDLLQIAPCRYSGSIEGQNLILLGHNYKRHFAPLKKLVSGDEVLFSAIDGTIYTFEVREIEILKKTQLEELTSSDYDLTLFTCTNGGYSRHVIRCSLKNHF